MSFITSNFMELINRELSKQGSSSTSTKTNRVILLVDMDCFYCQVEEKINPGLKGKPVAVVQYNAWKGGGIIAVNYAAREKGVTRHMRGDEAERVCSDIQLVQVPSIRGKADLTKYREAGKQVVEVLKSFTCLLERASVDEAYVDITASVDKRLLHITNDITSGHLKNTSVVGSDVECFLENIYENEELNLSNLKLAMGGVLAEILRSEVYKQTGYTCSAGIAHNKVLAKLACGLNKPNKQTVLPHMAVAAFYENLHIQKIRGLGGKFGNYLSEKLSIMYMSELTKFSEKELVQKFDEKTGCWLYNIARGIDMEPVITRLVSKSIGCCKKFPGKTALKTVDSVLHWLSELASELSERLDNDQLENNRKAKHMVVSFIHEIDKKDVSSSRTTILNSYDTKQITEDAYEVIKRHCLKPNGDCSLKFLGLSVGNFECCKRIRSITSFFKKSNSTDSVTEIKKPSVLEYKVDNSKSRATENYFNSVEECVKPKGKSKQNEKSPAYVVVTPDEYETNSVFSLSTDEDTTIDYDELVLYDNKNRIKIEGNKITQDISRYMGWRDYGVDNSYVTNDSSDQDSITGEIFLKMEQQPSSFFASYVKNLSANYESNIERHFDTSKVLQDTSAFEKDEISSSSEESATFSKENLRSPLELYGIASNFEHGQDQLVENSYASNSQTEKCQECGKILSKTELTSHLDYHLALNMVHSDSKILSPINLKMQTQNKVRKRKQSETKMPSILSYLRNTNITSKDGQVCPDCKKVIPNQEYVSHVDYHVAKRLHVEINTVETSSAQNKSNASSASKSKRSKKCSSAQVKSISSYFEPI